MAASNKPGPAVDASDRAAIDPTLNVKEYVSLQVQRQDDLRKAEQGHVREVLELRSKLGEQDSICAGEIAQLRAQHATELREAEAARIDAIRSVDVEAVQRAAEVQATQASTLATQVATSAETLRTQVAAAAQAATVALAAALEPIIKDVQDLRKTQYEQAGSKAQVVETRSVGANTGLWIGIGIAVLTVLVSAVGVVVVVLSS